jgi:hypothetical protein
MIQTFSDQLKSFVPQVFCRPTVFAIGHPLLEEYLQILESMIGY